MILSIGCLFDTVDGFMQFANMILSMKPCGCCMNTSSDRVPWRNALFITSCLRDHPRMTARLRTILTVVGLTIRLKVSWKLTPGRCWNPLATKWALYLSMNPLGRHLVRKIYLQPTTFFVGLAGTSSQVLLQTRTSYSSNIAWRHLGSLSAWDMVVGSKSSLVWSWAVRLSFWIGLWMLCLDLVTMTRGENGDSETGLLVVGGWWGEGWDGVEVEVVV